MKKYIKDVILFITPCATILLLPMIILFYNYEYFRNYDSIIKKDDYLIGFAYSNNHRQLKWNIIKNTGHHNTVLTLGSSRVLQFREYMFSTNFYNAGQTVTNITEFLPFLRSLPKKSRPKILIIGLDQWWFNENWPSYMSNNKDSSYWKEYDSIPGINIIITVYRDLFGMKYSKSIPQVVIPNKYGINAIYRNTGTRNDGSFYYGETIYKLINNLKYDPFEDTKNRIVNGNARFEYGNQIGLESLNELNDILSYCKENNIYVVGIIPPFANQIWEIMLKSGKYGYIDELSLEAQEIFNRFGFELYDVTNPKTIKSNDREFLDGFHGGELTYGKILLQMTKKGSKISRFIDLEVISSDIQFNDYQIYRY